VGPACLVAGIHKPLRVTFGATDSGEECPMPRICAFYGIVIWMYHDDHNPPHFHATYGEHDAAIEIVSCKVLRGSLPPRALRLVTEWASTHTTELAEDWDRARNGKALEPIAPLT
jgi:hypothetical protein